MAIDARQRAIEVVGRILDGDYIEDEIEALVAELTRLVPDPRVSDLVFWPQHHPLSAGLSEEELTPEVIVGLACRYVPFAL